MTLVDTNILLDVVTDDPRWAAWSIYQLDAAKLRAPIVINDIIYAELSVRFSSAEAVDGVLQEGDLTLRAMPREALFLAGKAFARYRASGGKRTGVLPDFFIGAQAEAESLTLLTRDPSRYRTYFPSLRLITPEH
jgi:predicted nucleic acid-binding protein